MKIRLGILLTAVLFTFQGMAQTHIKGKVTGKTSDGKTEVLPYANVYWAGTTEGTVSDEHGDYSLEIHHGHHHPKIVASYLGYINDTIDTSHGNRNTTFVLERGSTDLSEVEIRERQRGNYLSTLKPINAENVSSSGLKKMACCNLSESFQNSGTVDVGYSDAVSGAKQIQMLGLAGIYSQLQIENIPFNRGLDVGHGLSFVPGPWMESIQISKGASSVINGFESITGQINVELKKPDHSEKFFLNLFGNSEGRGETNVYATIPVAENLGTMLMFHGSGNFVKHDANSDSFLDIPLSRQLNFSNRWSFANEKTESKFGVNLMLDERESGQLMDHTKDAALQNGKYVYDKRTRRVQLYDKTGFVIPQLQEASIGTIWSGTYHKQEANFGNRPFNVTHYSFYGNTIFQNTLEHKHTLNAGLSFMYDNYDQQFADTTMKTKETVPGGYFQYTYSPGDNFTVIGAIRGDYHNEFGFFVTPRAHLKLNIFENTILRASVGKGFRSPQVLMENTGLLMSSRRVIFREALKLEEALNYGVNLMQNFETSDGRVTSISLDFYATDFVNQAVVDLDQGFDRLVFYNLDGKSFSKSLQATLTGEVLNGLELTGVYRLNDVQVTTAGELRERPLVSKVKGLVSASYSTKFDKWQFDLTGQYTGKSRLPINSPLLHQVTGGDYSEPFTTIYAQITRRFKKFELYAGGENLTNFTMDYPVIDAGNPFGPQFDAGMIWGPIMGRMFYGGLRYVIR